MSEGHLVPKQEQALMVPARSLLISRGLPFTAKLKGSSLADLKSITPSALPETDAEALYKLGELHYYGIDEGNDEDPKDDEESARHFYQMAAELGYPPAQHMIAVMLERGSGGQPDPTGAVTWYRMAADKGYYAAQRRLGRPVTRFRKDKPLPLDPEEILHWRQVISELAQAGEPHAQWEQGDYHIAAGDEEEAYKSYQQAAERGCIWMPYELARLYAGRGDLTQAIHWYRRASEQGYQNADFRLAEIFAYKTEPPNWSEAAKYFRKEAERGSAYSQMILAKLYARGEGVPADQSEACKWFYKAAVNSEENAFSIAVMYATGFEGIPKDFVLAFLFFTLAGTEYNSEVRKTHMNALIKAMTPKQWGEATQRAAVWTKERQSFDSRV